MSRRLQHRARRDTKDFSGLEYQRSEMAFSPTCVILAPVLISISNTGIWIGDMVICTMTHGNELANSLEIRHANLGIRMSSR
jgi:hypothetical protein